MPSIAQSAAWKALAEHHKSIQDVHMRDLFATDSGRFETFSIRLGDMLLDFSKNRITAETLGLLTALARAADVEGWRERMFAGEKINNTENRAVLHV
ncbi:MAG: glucose-6-phosphate isomerase, partial [Rhodospirillales bacterium]|nr:glucose-6-phosphate isomerase [Rhodospirillales bacterium]